MCSPTRMQSLEDEHYEGNPSSKNSITYNHWSYARAILAFWISPKTITHRLTIVDGGDRGWVSSWSIGKVSQTPATPTNASAPALIPPMSLDDASTAAQVSPPGLYRYLDYFPGQHPHHMSHYRSIRTISIYPVRDIIDLQVR